MLMRKHATALNHIKNLFQDSGYRLSFRLLNAADYEVPQDRKRVFFVGIRKDLDQKYCFPRARLGRITLRDSIYDLKDCVSPALPKNKTNGPSLCIPNHEYLIGNYSTIYMSRNRVRNWDELSYTIQAGGRHAPMHPQAPKMLSVGKDKRIFVAGRENLYRRLSVRECARIQTFPDDFIFHYDTVSDGYKMIGNAVPVKLAYIFAKSIISQIGYRAKSMNSQSQVPVLVNE